MGVTGPTDGAVRGTLMVEGAFAKPRAAETAHLHGNEDRKMDTRTERPAMIRLVALNITRNIAATRLLLSPRRLPHAPGGGVLGKRWMTTAALMAVSVSILASFTWPASAAAQHLGTCGACRNHQSILIHAHRFDAGLAMVFRNCDNVGGCHYSWYTNRCHPAHTVCSWQAFGGEDMAELTPDALAIMLASSQDWTYDPVEDSLSFLCSGYTVARYILSEDLAKVVVAHLANEESGAEPIVGSVQSPDGGVRTRLLQSHPR